MKIYVDQPWSWLRLESHCQGLEKPRKSCTHVYISVYDATTSSTTANNETGANLQFFSATDSSLQDESKSASEDSW